MGRPKALIPIDGITLLERTVGIAATAISDVVLLGRPPFELPGSLQRLAVVDDTVPGIGPIGGLAAFFAARPTTDCLLLACDMPRLDVELLRRLVASVDDTVDAVVPRVGDATGELHPCCAVYRHTAAPAVAAALAVQRYDMHGLLGRLRCRPLPLNASESTWVENWNLPADVASGDISLRTPDVR